MFKLGLEKAEEPEIKLPTCVGSQKKQENSRKKIYFCFIDYTNGEYLKIWKYQTTLPASRKICLQVKEQQLEPDMEQWTGSKLEKE